MDAVTRIERALAAAVDRAAAPGAPGGSPQAMRYAVFPRGARVRPRLCLAVAAPVATTQPVACRRGGVRDRAAALRLAGA